MSHVGVAPWPALWADTPSLLIEARRIEYLVTVAANGDLGCKACGRYIPGNTDGGRHEHFAMHQAQLDRYLASKQEEKRDEDAEGFYPAPCTSCGNPIPRSGKPGRPPAECDLCRFPLARPALQSEAPEGVLDPEVWG